MIITGVFDVVREKKEPEPETKDYSSLGERVRDYLEKTAGSGIQVGENVHEKDNFSTRVANCVFPLETKGFEVYLKVVNAKSNGSPMLQLPETLELLVTSAGLESRLEDFHGLEGKAYRDSEMVGKPHNRMELAIREKSAEFPIMFKAVYAQGIHGALDGYI